jgi:hypothetical protein
VNGVDVVLATVGLITGTILGVGVGWVLGYDRGFRDGSRHGYRVAFLDRAHGDIDRIRKRLDRLDHIDPPDELRKAGIL